VAQDRRSSPDIKPQAPVDVTAGVIGSKLPAVSAARRRPAISSRR
jgi:hypothetical protein